MRAEEASLEKGSGKRWPTLLGVGPAKSGSTIVADILEWSGRVVVGKLPCCKGETNFLVNRRNFTQGLRKYADFFEVPAEKVVGYYDKTPEYAVDYLAPFRGAAFLNPKRVRLIFTMRNHLDMDASQFFHFKVDKNYNDWVPERIENLKVIEDCRKKTFSSLFSSTLSLKDLYDRSIFSVESTLRVEETIQETCGYQRNSRANILRGHFFENLIRRWTHVFPDTDYLCVANEDLVMNPAHSMKRIYAFVGLGDIPVEATGSHLDPNRTLHKLVKATLRQQQTTNDEEGTTTQASTLFNDHDIRLNTLATQKKLLDYLTQETSCHDLQLLHDVCGFTPNYVPFRHCRQTPTTNRRLASYY